jgi:hypothetical protein
MLRLYKGLGQLRRCLIKRRFFKAAKHDSLLQYDHSPTSQNTTMITQMMVQPSSWVESPNQNQQSKKFASIQVY